MISVLDGDGLDAAVRRIQQQVVHWFPDVLAREQELPVPWEGATSLIGTSLEVWDADAQLWVPITSDGTPVTVGTLDSLSDVTVPAPTDGQVLMWDTTTSQWVAETPSGGAITSPLVIPDPVGAELPELHFLTGDGNAAGITARTIKMQLYANYLRFIDIGLNPATVIGGFMARSTTMLELAVGAWNMTSDTGDGYLRFHYGADRATAEFWCSNAGDLATRGGLSTGASANIAGWLTVPNVTLTSNYIYGTNSIFLNGQGANAASFQINASNGGVHPICYLASYPSGNGWNNRPLCVAKHGGAGEVAVGFVNHSTGYTAAIQLYSDGAYYFGAINGANSGYVKWLASAFQVASSKHLKADIEDLSDRRDRPTSMSRIVRRVRSVRYRDLQHEMAIEASSPPIEGVPREPQPPIEQRFRFGLIAEEVEEEAPELVMSSPHGPTLDLSGLVAVLWQAVRELSDKVAHLEHRLEGTS